MHPNHFTARPRPTARPGSRARPGPGLAALLIAGLGALAPAPAAAQTPPSGGTGGTGIPGADQFTILYYLTDAEGNRQGRFSQQYFDQFLNKARCECGHKIWAEIRLKSSMTGFNQSTQVDTFVGSQCATAETAPVGQFRRCAQLASNPISKYTYGLSTSFHPVWLVNGVALSSESRLPDEALAAGKCEGTFGEAGIWMCAQTNTTAGCQSDEFFIQGTHNTNLPSKMGGIKFDFVPPLTEPENLRSESGDSAIVLSWDILNPGDINGYRVLCEDADTHQPVAGKAQPRPTLLGLPNGTYYYTTELVCPNGPFSTYMSGEDNPLDMTGTDTDGGTDTGFDATGGTGGGGDPGAIDFVCGDGTIDPDEECDDGAENSDDGDCRTDCTRNRCGDGVVWAMGGEECDDGNDIDGDDCTNVCKTAVCGDGSYWVGMETCDDGNVDDGDACNSDCTPAACVVNQSCPFTCGNGLQMLDPGEECDGGANNSDLSTCTTTCKNNVCGDGLVLSDPAGGGEIEECDDGANNSDTGACTAVCLKATCGDGFVWAGVEACDDGMNNGDNGACLSNCQPARCGDGLVQTGVEDCDLGPDNGPGSTCSEECTFNAGEGLRNLDWDYVCTGHLQALNRSVRIDGLENGKTYNFRLVPYDAFGNPLLMDQIVQAAPVETYDLWEQCEADGGVCGESGFCNVGDDPGGLAAFSAIAAIGLGGLGVRRRKRNHA